METLILNFCICEMGIALILITSQGSMNIEWHHVLEYENICKIRHYNDTHTLMNRIKSEDASMESI